ncbi:glycoside hydrolase domain-containing protein [Kitasatospora sp. MAP12-15]|uniref:glycoside hydrolase domain-containing protein n=1 Tax=unclassified Kitasatospora TaxID=2633591 RepID=UPI003D1CADF5
MRTDRAKALTAIGAMVALMAAGAGTAEAASTKAVSYLGHTFQVPAGWPVVDLTANPSSCVRFDQHAVYLGTPGAEQACPSHPSARTEALLIEPRTDGGADTRTVDNPSAGELDAVAPKIKVTATYGSDRSTVSNVLQQAGFGPASTFAQHTSSTVPRPATPRAAAAATAQGAATAAAVVSIPGTTTDYTGAAFDACSAPSTSDLSAWAASPYRGLGIYIGGRRACAQPNLTNAWLQQESAAGWKFLPIYVSPSASSLTSPSWQGVQSADDAANQAQALGFAPGTTLYADMEQYTSTYSSNVLAYLAAWTTEIHARGFHSGVYSSSSSGISDLAGHYSAYAMPDVIWDANWNGAANTNDAAVPAAYWSNHQRVHQYDGNVTESYNGVTIGIDHDYADVMIAGTPVTANNRLISTIENGTLHNVYPAGDGWHDDALPVGGNIWATALAYLNGNPTQAVVEGGALHIVWLDAAGWHDDAVPGVGGPVSAVALAYNPVTSVGAFEVVENGVLHEVYQDSAGWHDGAIPTAGSVSAVSIAYKASGDRVLETIEGGVLHEIYADSTGWHDGVITGSAGNASAVSFAIDPTGSRVIEAVENGVLHEIYADSAGWHDNPIGVGGSVNAVSMVRHSDGTRVLEAAESGALHEIYTDSTGWHDNAVGNTGGGVVSVSLAYH